jgi:hypothetical protein
MMKNLAVEIHVAATLAGMIADRRAISLAQIASQRQSQMHQRLKLTAVANTNVRHVSATALGMVATSGIQVMGLTNHSTPAN